MARTGKCHLCVLFAVMFLILASLGLLVTSIVTEYWYEVNGEASTNATLRREYSYHMGMWRKCYRHGIPLDIPLEYRQGDCVLTYKNLTMRAEDNMSSDDYRYLSMERSWVALMITAAALLLFTILAVICGLWPGDCHSIKRSTLYLIAAIMCLLAAMAAIASGICFIALRDLDITKRHVFPPEVELSYRWSFILGWVGTGLSLIDGFLFLGLLKMDYEDVAESGRYQTM